jgi:hypothetical protein
MAKAKKAKAAKKAKPVAKTKTRPAGKEVALRPGVKVNAESKKLFIERHLVDITRLAGIAKTSQSNLRNAYKKAKSDGFLKRDFDVAFKLQSQMGEREIKATIARDLTIAKWLGYSLGKQLDLFASAPDHDVVAQAYSEGEEASRTNKPASPIYAPGTEGYEAYMRGFHEQGGKTGLTGDKIPPLGEYQSTSGVPMTRSQFKAQQAARAAKTKADTYTKAQERRAQAEQIPDEDGDDDEQAGMFSKRGDAAE